jgi:ATP-binding cassette subfamily B protein
MSTGEVIAFIGYVTQILAALIVISNLVVIYTKAFASVGRIIEVFETMPSIINVPVMKNDNDSKDSKYILEFQGVSMSYEPGGAFDIEHISFRIKAGEMVGIIGGTGSGKSTIVNLIPRFYDVSQGRILVEGKDVREYELYELRNKIGVVPQKSVLFSGTIAENIRWGKADATDAEVQQAAEIAQAAEFIKIMPDGYESKIQKGGVNVSGGQRQRLTIARALVRKPSILILDDSFNALDFATDAALRKSLKESTKDMTTLIVTQRASSIRNADQIIVVSEGIIAGIGKHEELINTCQIYKEICESQEVTSTAI